MTKLTKRVLVEDFYQTDLAEDIAELGDISFNVVTPPKNSQGFIIINPTSVSEREKVFYSNVVGNRIYVKGANRLNPKLHAAGVTVQINDTADIFNYLTNNISTTFYVEKISSLGIKVWGGPVLVSNIQVGVNDTNLTLSDNSKNYICYNHLDNSITAATSEQYLVVAEVTAASGIITGIDYRNMKISIVSAAEAMDKQTYDPNYTEGDVFSMGNMSETNEAKVFTDAERFKLASIEDGATGNPDLSGYQAISQKGQANGYASLDSNGTIPAIQLPAYVDDIVEYVDYPSLPTSGATGIIYVTVDDGKLFRWSGSQYVEIAASGGSTYFNQIIGSARDNPDLADELDAKVDLNSDITIHNDGPTLRLRDSSLGGDSSWYMFNFLGILEFKRSGVDMIKMGVDGNFELQKGNFKLLDGGQMGTDPKEMTTKGYVDEFLKSNPTPADGESKVGNIVLITQANYDALTTKVSDTLYVITD